MEPEPKYEKTCPIMSDMNSDSECEKEECAWYDVNNRQCCIKTIATSIGNQR